MIQVTPHIRIFLSTEPVDFRKGIDGLARVCREVLKQDPFSGGMFIFRNKRGSTLKILVYDGQGFWLCSKRLSTGRFDWWPRAGGSQAEGRVLTINAAQLHLLLYNGDAGSVKIGENWKNIS